MFQLSSFYCILVQGLGLKVGWTMSGGIFAKSKRATAKYRIETASRMAALFKFLLAGLKTPKPETPNPTQNPKTLKP